MKAKEFLQILKDRQLVSKGTLDIVESMYRASGAKQSAKDIAKHLVEIGAISANDAARLLMKKSTGSPPASAKTVEEFDVAVPTQKESQDTDELIDLGVKQPSPSKPADTVWHTRYDLDALPDEGGTGQVERPLEPAEFGSEVVELEELPGDQLEAVYDPLDTVPYAEAGAVAQESHAPGFVGKKRKRNQWESKWPFIGFGLLGFLVIIGAILYYTLFRTSAEEMYSKAQDAFQATNYQTAYELFDKFVRTYPSDEKASIARVRMANCELRIPYDGRRWEAALDKAKTVLPEIEAEEDFSEIRQDLAVILPGVAHGFTLLALEETTIGGKQNRLDQVDDVQQLIDNGSYLPGSQKNNPAVRKMLDDIENNRNIVLREIEKETQYEERLSKIQELTESGKTDDAFQVFYDLVRRYPDLAVREPLRESMRAVSQREADLVSTAEADLPRHTAEAESPILASVVVPTRVGKPIAALGDEVIPYLVQGAVYGVRASDGAVLWRRFVGYQTRSQPIWLDEETRQDLILVDGRSNEVLRVGAATGDLVWRVEIGQRFAEPQIAGDQIFVTTADGHLYRINAEDGSSSRSAKLPQNAIVGAVAAERDPFVYQIGNYSNIYVLSNDDLGCREVFYLAHPPGSVTIPPFILAGHILVAENGVDYCQLHILRPAERGLKLQQAQPPIRLKGRVTSPIQKYQRWGMVMSEAGDVRMLEVNLADEARPVTDVMRLDFDANPGIGHSMHAEDGQFWTAGMGVRRYKIQKALAKFDRQELVDNLDIFIAPILKRGDTLFHLRKRNGSALASVAAVDALTLKEIWRTDLGAPLAGAPLTESINSPQAWAVSSQGDLFMIDESAIETHVAAEPVARGSTTVQSLLFDRIVPLADGRFVAVGPLDRTAFLSVELGGDPSSRLANLNPPADKPGCPIVALDSELLVLTRRGQAFRVDSVTGAIIGSPFQPPLEPGVEIPWVQPAVLSDQRALIADGAGRFYLVRADGTSLAKIDEYEHGSPILSPLAPGGDAVYAVSRQDGADRILRFAPGNKITVDLSMELPAGYIAGPMIVGDLVLVVVDTGQLVAFSADLSTLWAVDLPQDQLAGTPALLGDHLAVALQSGDILLLDTATGTVGATIQLRQALASGPVVAGDRVLIAGTDGVVHVMANPQ